MLSGKVLVKHKGKWFRAVIKENGKVGNKKKIVGNLRDAKPGYISLTEYAKAHSLGREEILKKYGMENIYVLDVKEPIASKSTEANEKAFEAYWWRFFNKVCLSCSKECKQSSRLTVVKCPSYDSL